MPAALVRKLTLGLGVGVFACLLGAGTIGATAASPSPSASGSAAASPGASGSPGAGNLPGDPSKGQQAYSAAGCTACHGRPASKGAWGRA